MTVNCESLLRKNRIFSLQPDEIKSNFRKWSLRHHPDKGGDPEVFKDVSNCKQEIVEQRESAQGVQTPKASTQRSKGTKRSKQTKRSKGSKRASTSKKCKVGYETQKSNGRCRKSCKSTQDRWKGTARCRKSCKSGYERSSTHGRCIKSCKSNQVRSQKTKRCRKSKK